MVSHRTLRVVIGLWATISVLMAGLTNALVFTITIDRGLGAEAVGLVLSAFAVGSLGGSLVAARLAPKPVGLVMLGRIGRLWRDAGGWPRPDAAVGDDRGRSPARA